MRIIQILVFVLRFNYVAKTQFGSYKLQILILRFDLELRFDWEAESYMSFSFVFGFEIQFGN